MVFLCNNKWSPPWPCYWSLSHGKLKPVLQKKLQIKRINKIARKVFWKIMEQVILEAIIGHTMDWWLGTDSVDLPKANQGLTKPVAFYDALTGLVDKTRPVLVYWDFSKTFGTVSLIMLVVKQVRYSLPTIGWVENQKIWNCDQQFKAQQLMASC